MRKSMTLENVPLINDSLRGVHPFDPKVDEATRKLVAREICDNPSYRTIVLDMADKLQHKVIGDYLSKKE